MAKHYRPWNPTQSFLLPPSPLDWLPDGHLALFILDVIRELDLEDIHAKYQAKDHRGTRSHNPWMMTALLLYAYCIGMPSSRRIERATHEDVAFRVIAGGAHPDHTRISEFRRENLAELAGLFVQALLLCREAGLVKLGHVALDGTKVDANASKHKAMSYERMSQTEARLRAEIDSLLAGAEKADQEEDALHGKGRRGDEVPEELRRREERLKRIGEAKAKLEAAAAAARARELQEQAERASRQAEAAEEDSERNRAQGRARERAAKAAKAAEKASEKAIVAGEEEPDLEPTDPTKLPSHQVPATTGGDPRPEAQRNFTDPDSRIMKRGGEFVQAYNCQAVVDEHAQVIVAQALTNQAPDTQHFVPMINEVHRNCGQLPEKVSADSGYWSELNDAFCKDANLDAYIATGRQRRSDLPQATQGSPPPGLDAKGQMAWKLRTEGGRQIYSRRKVIVEPVFGNIKEPRGFRRFSLRGADKARGEWSLVCAVHNLLKLFKFRSTLQLA